MPRVLVAYDSKHGSTGQVAQTVADTLRGVGVEVHVERVDHVDDLERMDAVVLGAPVYMGRWTKAVRSLLHERHAELAAKPIAVFATGPLHEDEQEFAQARACVEKALAATPDVAPRDVQVFGGSLDPADHHFPFNRMEPADVRDWDAIRSWARALPAALGVAPG
jgi:menaquinone-dependent protoporphyrinogen oxidase